MNHSSWTLWHYMYGFFFYAYAWYFSSKNPLGVVAKIYFLNTSGSTKQYCTKMLYKLVLACFCLGEISVSKDPYWHPSYSPGTTGLWTWDQQAPRRCLSFFCFLRSAALPMSPKRQRHRQSTLAWAKEMFLNYYNKGSVETDTSMATLAHHCIIENGGKQNN